MWSPPNVGWSDKKITERPPISIGRRPCLTIWTSNRHMGSGLLPSSKVERMSPFDAPGEWLRCALHAHTTNSDGELAPEMLVRHYDWAGYDVLAITDHWVRTAEASTKGLLVIPSTELNAVVGDDCDVHVLALGLDADPVAPADTFAPLADA